MNQMDLFDVETTATDAAEPETFPVRSGRVGPVRFGSTDASFALTREVLIDLTMRLDHAGESSS